MRRRTICTMIACVILLAGAVDADIKQHPIGLQIWIPDTWETEIDEGLLMTTSPDDSAIVILLVLHAREVEMASSAMDKELMKFIKNIRTVTPAEEIYINGLRGFSEDGTGTVDGVPIEWMSGLFPYRNQALMVLAFVQSTKAASYENMLVEIFSSLKPY